jgi:putative tryptophan/tyrosine transport system substrate-binding protein
VDIVQSTRLTQRGHLPAWTYAQNYLRSGSEHGGRAMKRREFIMLIGSMALMTRRTALAQATDHARRVGVLMNIEADEPLGATRFAAFRVRLQQLGWIDGNNVRIDIRWCARDADRVRKCATELIALKPDILVAFGSTSVDALQRVAGGVPIVFANVIDPVGAGFVSNLARPGAKMTGFSVFEYSISGKWLELLKEMAPNVTRVAVLRDAALAAGIGQFAAIQAMAPRSLELTLIDMRDPAEIERAMAAFASEPNGGLIVTASPLSIVHRDLIISLATQFRLPNIYPFRYYPANGGLASYGPDSNDEYGRASVYVDRVLKGESPANLPVQTPTKYELIINLKTAKAFGLTIPSTLIARADEVIE